MKRLAFLYVLLCSTAWAATPARTGTCAAQANTCTLSATATGDVQVAFIYNHNSRTFPTIPPGWVLIDRARTTTGGVLAAAAIACHIASSGGDTAIAAFTVDGGAGISAASYSGTAGNTTVGCAAGIGNETMNQGKAATAAGYGATNVDHTVNWVVGMMGDSTGGSGTPTCTPTGMTPVQAADGAAPSMRISDSNGTYASGNWPARTCVINGSTRITAVVELVAPCQASWWCGDDFIDMNTGSVGDALNIATNLPAGTHGPDSAMWDWPDNHTHLVIGASQTGCPLPKAVTVAGTTYGPNNTGKSIEWNGTADSQTARLQLASATPYWVTAMTCAVPTPPDAADAWSTYDMLVCEDVAGYYGVVQYISGTGASTTCKGPHFQMETAGSSNLPNICNITPGHPYWVALACDHRGGKAYLDVYDAATGALLPGGSVSNPMSVYTPPQAFRDMRYGNNEIGKVCCIYLQNAIIDYTTHQWPMNFTLDGNHRRVESSWH